MPVLPASLSNPGLLLGLCLVVGLVIGTNAMLLSLFRRGKGNKNPGEGQEWARALGGARARQQQQAAQLEELHRAVTELAAGKTDPDKSHG